MRVGQSGQKVGSIAAQTAQCVRTRGLGGHQVDAGSWMTAYCKYKMQNTNMNIHRIYKYSSIMEPWWIPITQWIQIQNTNTMTNSNINTNTNTGYMPNVWGHLALVDSAWTSGSIGGGNGHKHRFTWTLLRRTKIQIQILEQWQNAKYKYNQCIQIAG